MASIINAATSGGLITTADTSGILQLQTAGTTAVTVDASQNVGIGTASPSVKFEISSTSVATARISSSQTSPNNILMTGGSSYNYGVIGVNTGNNTSTGDIFQLGYTASAGAAPTSVLQWSSAAKCIGLNTNPSTTGTGITFPATQSASSDANTLDDYEEGTWTPSQGAGLTVTGTFTSSGTYTKIGRQVLVNGRLTATTLATSAGGIMCGGLPFTVERNTLGAAVKQDYMSTTQIIADSGGLNIYSTSTGIAAATNIYFSVVYSV
jgi:hypothetical protein